MYVYVYIHVCTHMYILDIDENISLSIQSIIRKDIYNSINGVIYD